MIATSTLFAGIGAAAAIASATTGIVAAANKPKAESAPVYNADAERKKAEEAASAKHRKVQAEQTDTVNTSALGNTQQVNTGKTVLGG
jgi:hypothetical protein